MSDDYFLEIESRFAQRRGTPFVLSAKDWALMKGWSEEGVPLPVVLEAIDSVFDKNEAKGTKKAINSLSYCRHAVKELWQERRDLQIGAEADSPEENVAPILERLASSLEASSHAIVAASASRIRELSREQSVPKIEERLMELEQELIDSVLPEAADLRDQARALATGADEKTRKRAEEAHLRRLVRERFAIPRFTLF